MWKDQGTLIEQLQCMNYSNTVVMHATKEKLRGMLEKTFYAPTFDEQNIEKDR